MPKKCGVAIKVTRDHIENGEPEDTNQCAIALAVKEAFGIEDVSVGGEIQVGNMTFKNSKEVNTFIRNFDTKGVVEDEYFTKEERKPFIEKFKKAKPFTLYLTNGRAIAG